MNYNHLSLDSALCHEFSKMGMAVKGLMCCVFQRSVSLGDGGHADHPAGVSGAELLQQESVRGGRGAGGPALLLQVMLHS